MSISNDNVEESPEDYELTLNDAAKALGKSKRTIHRYIEQGRLSKIYQITDHGKEIRLKRKEVLDLVFC